MNEENEKMFHDACLEWFADLKFDIQGFSTNERLHGFFRQIWRRLRM